MILVDNSQKKTYKSPKKTSKFKEPQNTQNSQSYSEWKEENWRNHIIWLQIILKNYSKQNSMVLA